MEPISNLIKFPKESRKTERGELLKFFAEKMNLSIPRVAKHLQHLTLEDMYYLQSVMKDTERRNGIESARKYWWWSIRPEK